MISRVAGSRVPFAALRAMVMAALALLPHLLLGDGSPGGRQLAGLSALILALFVFSEYASRSPILVEFRDARPYNRIRVVAVLSALILVCLAIRHDLWPESSPGLTLQLGAAWGDLPGSPVRLLARTMPEPADPVLARTVLDAAAMAYGVSLLMVVAFALAIRLGQWPGRSAFNVWINLPQFDPTAGGDLVGRLRRDAQVNLILGLLLPWLAPLAADLLAAPFEGAALREPVALVWTVMAWAFIPASLAMRGLALHRLAALIAAHRARLRQAGVLPQAI
ncbi:hypothetical protein [Rubellimicrobium aerolatum]|uniref:RDD family protein n=1 Tax=Rubellimicrobium aerolatum TaxID=490979 RepID=A0ABW0SFH6_9RHOB|nr:hypothetical protein [Rubellimicrobium aerolatum]MBP1807232.1 hypothetical protein [Rubellimicrobium aerolatum]